MMPMTVGVVHHARLAWDAARIVVAVADGDEDRLYQWLAGRLDTICGWEYEQALSISRTRLMYQLRADATAVEAGMWRARLQDLLDRRPELVPPLQALVEELAPLLRQDWSGG
jgi:hypothetical protein